MSARSLVQKTTVELVTLFAELGIEQDTALLKNEISVVNKIHDKMDAIAKELKGRGR